LGFSVWVNQTIYQLCRYNGVVSLHKLVLIISNCHIRRERWTYTISVNLQLDRVVDSVESDGMQQRSNSSIRVFPTSSACPVHGINSLPVCRSSSWDSLFIGNNGFIKVLLAQNTGFLVGLDCVGTIFQLCTWARHCKLTRRNRYQCHHRCIATSHLKS
jgi:hypothetical protein